MPHKSAVHTKEKARLSKTTSECNVNVFKESNYYSSSVNMNASSSLMTAYAVTALLFGVKKHIYFWLLLSLTIFFSSYLNRFSAHFLHTFHDTLTLCLLSLRF